MCRAENNENNTLDRASYKNESCKDDGWFKIFPNFTWANRKITVFAMLQQ